MAAPMADLPAAHEGGDLRAGNRGIHRHALAEEEHLCATAGGRKCPGVSTLITFQYSGSSVATGRAGRGSGKGAGTLLKYPWWMDQTTQREAAAAQQRTS